MNKNKIPETEKVHAAKIMITAKNFILNLRMEKAFEFIILK